MDAESDMVTAIVQAIEIDYLIEQSITSRLIKHDEKTIELLSKDNGPLATFFSKIVLGYALGIFNDEIMEYLHTVRRIRNAFAHARKDISFSTDLIREEMSALKSPTTKDPDLAKAIELIKRLSSRKIEVTTPGINTNALTGRAAYVILCQALITYFLREQTETARARSLRFHRSINRTDTSK